jgi:hypothetical protein
MDGLPLRSVGERDLGLLQHGWERGRNCCRLRADDEFMILRRWTARIVGLAVVVAATLW